MSPGGLSHGSVNALIIEWVMLIHLGCHVVFHVVRRGFDLGLGFFEKLV